MSPIPAEFDDISREGPPTTEDGSEWTVRLSSFPPTEWLQAFHAPPEHTSIATPGALRLMGDGTLRFRGSRDHVREWVKYIDMWSAHANAHYRKFLDDQRRRAADQAKRDTEDARRIRALNDEFKDL
jgi:hypothetical protein